MYHHSQQHQSNNSHHRRGQILNERVASSLDKIVDRLNDPFYNILALMVGTSDGVGLARSFGTSKSSPHLSDEVISGIESVWATLPSGSGHHLRPLGLGDDVKTVTAFYENCTLVHMHTSPLVVTFLATPNANVGAIRAILPNLQEALEPIRQTLLDTAGGTRARIK